MKEQEKGDGLYPELSPRQVDLLLFLNLIGPADEGDLAHGLYLSPKEMAQVPPGFAESAGEYVALQELENLARLGLVSGDGVVWELTARGRELLEQMASR